MKQIILGAGVTGLAASIKTKAPIYEASDHAGGICRSYVKDGFQFSTGGGHWIFGKGPGLDFIKTQVNLNEYERKAGIYYNHTFPYPIQTTAQQPYVGNKHTTLKYWLGDNFSQAECNLFFFPFNEKYTAGLYDDIIQFDDYKTPKAGGVGFVPTFCDPVGGLNTLISTMEKQCTIHYNKKLVRVYTDAKRVLFEDGTHEDYDRLISTIPLNKLLDYCGQHSHDLPYTSVFVLNIGAKRGWNTPDEHWLYIPFCKTRFYRIGFYSNVNKDKAPSDKVSLSVEMAMLPDTVIDVEQVSFDIISELQNWRFIGDVVTEDPTFVKTAYTWLRNKEDREKHLEWLKECDIISTGRYGSWVFTGMVGSIEMGLSL